MNAYQGNNPYVFVSYAHKDNEKVLDLIKLLNVRCVEFGMMKD